MLIGPESMIDTIPKYNNVSIEQNISDEEGDSEVANFEESVH